MPTVMLRAAKAAVVLAPLSIGLALFVLAIRGP